MTGPLRCGRIRYTNDLPIYAAFDAGAVACPAQLVPGVPTELNAMLLRGELDVSPISSFFCAEHADRFAIVPGICIGSRREVRSIYCISKTLPPQLAGVPIAATTESSTGRNLFAVVCAERYGFKPQYVDSADPYAAYRSDGSPCLLIGDKAIDAALAANRADVHDIGDLWHAATQRRMVYALWAVRREVAAGRPQDVAELSRALLRALTWGNAHRDQVVGAAQSVIARPEGFYLDYFETLNFNFDDQAWLGLETFLTLAVKHGLLAAQPHLEFFRGVPSHA